MSIERALWIDVLITINVWLKRCSVNFEAAGMVDEWLAAMEELERSDRDLNRLFQFVNYRWVSSPAGRYPNAHKWADRYGNIACF